jgi:putative chitinase
MQGIAEAISAYADAREINTPLRMAHFLGQTSVESAGFSRLEENLNYSAERLCAVWPKRFPNIASAQPYAHNPQALAEKVYGGRMGNAPGEAWSKRGSGLIQITGHDNFALVSSLTGEDCLANPDLLRTPEHAVKAACAWWQSKGLNELADRDDVRSITRTINGGLTALDERTKATERAKQALGNA